MNIDDVSEASHGQRTRNALEHLCGRGFQPKHVSVADLATAENMATAEMLDEIHFMLRELVKRPAFVDTRSSWARGVPGLPPI